MVALADVSRFTAATTYPINLHLHLS